MEECIYSLKLLSRNLVHLSDPAGWWISAWWLPCSREDEEDFHVWSLQASDFQVT